MKKIIKLVASIIICESIGLISSIFTVSAIPGWYKTLNKPEFSPPNFLFGPVWTILYLLMGISLYLIWIKGIKNRKVKTALYLFAGQLFLNFLWSLLFFGLHSPLLAFFDIIALWIMILLTIINFAKISKPASYILYPYLVWVSFAAILNLFIMILN